MKLGTLGCSHSSDILGDSWPVFLAEKLNYELCQYHSSGAGNEGITVEKLVHMLENDAPDLIVISFLLGNILSSSTIGSDILSQGIGCLAFSSSVSNNSLWI